MLRYCPGHREDLLSSTCSLAFPEWATSTPRTALSRQALCTCIVRIPEFGQIRHSLQPDGEARGGGPSVFSSGIAVAAWLTPSLDWFVRGPGGLVWGRGRRGLVGFKPVTGADVSGFAPHCPPSSTPHGFLLAWPVGLAGV